MIRVFLATESKSRIEIDFSYITLDKQRFLYIIVQENFTLIICKR